MIFPLSPQHQEQMAKQLLISVKGNLPPVVHVVRFPSLSINHAIVLFAALEQTNAIYFTAYDPNEPDQPTQLTFDRTTRRFALPQNHYFAGGRVDVYEIYCSRWY